MVYKIKSGISFVVVIALCASGCATPNIDLATLQRPARATELAAFDVFVGNWDWTAKTLNAVEGTPDWSGTAQWSWALDQRCLHGTMSAKSGDTEYETAGVWSWHPVKRSYMWWMFNNWGYPQEGRAEYDASSKTWQMTYKGVGLDGTDSYGTHIIRVRDDNTLEWTLTEWADPFKTIKKIELVGTYKRRT